MTRLKKKIRISIRSGIRMRIRIRIMTRIRIRIRARLRIRIRIRKEENENTPHVVFKKLLRVALSQERPDKKWESLTQILGNFYFLSCYLRLKMHAKVCKKSGMLIIWYAKYLVC